MSARVKVKQEDITRAIRGVTKAGIRVGRVEIDNSGKIIILSDTTPELSVVPNTNSWDRALL